MIGSKCLIQTKRISKIKRKRSRSESQNEIEINATKTAQKSDLAPMISKGYQDHLQFLYRQYFPTTPGYRRGERCRGR